MSDTPRMEFSYWWTTRITTKRKKLVKYLQANRFDVSLLAGWILVTWSIVRWSIRAWAASFGLYLFFVAATEAFSVYTASKLAAIQRRRDA